MGILQTQPVSGNERCDSAIEIPLPGGFFSGTTAGGSDDLAGSCQGQGAPDSVFKLRLPTASFVQVDTLAASFDNVLYLRGQCSGPDALCSDNFDAFGLERKAFPYGKVDAGEYFLVIDGAAGGSRPFAGSYRLGVWAFPIESATGNDHCENAQPVGELGGYFEGSTEGLTDDEAISCDGGVGTEGPEAYFQVELTQRAGLRVDVDSPGTLSTWVRRGGCGGPVVACGIEGRQPIQLDPGSYLVAVDADSPDAGAPYRLTVRVFPPLPR